jgi:DNA-binding transcriptional MerR regulator
MTVTKTVSQWGIQGFAKIFNITPRTLRFYEDKGLISPKRQNGMRVFGPRDYVRTERIIRAKELGFSLDDIKDLFAVIDGEVKGKTALLARKDRMEAAVSQLRRNRDNIDSAVGELETLIGRIDTYVDTADEDGVFEHAAAFWAILPANAA